MLGNSRYHVFSYIAAIFRGTSIKCGYQLVVLVGLE